MESWFKRNLVNLILVAAAVMLIVYFTRDKSPAQIWDGFKNIALMLLGLGFVIFIHELGHFLAAKFCNVHVETFSIGFGPAIPGCRFRFGETEYKIAWFPLGGYVKMPGEYPSEQQEESVKNDPRAFMNKAVWQRMIIISAGVVMNVILGMVCFAYVYQTGKTEYVPQVSHVEPGSPADRAGIKAGAMILQIGDNQKPSFEDLIHAAAAARPDVTPIYFRWKNPGDPTIHEKEIVPTKRRGDPKPVIGVGFPPGVVLHRRAAPDRSPAYPGTPAAKAEFRPGDRIVGIREAGGGAFIPVDDGWELLVQEHRWRGKQVEYQVLRDDELRVIAVEPRFTRTLGFTPEYGRVIRVVDGSLAKRLKTECGVTGAAGTVQAIEPGDRIVAVIDADGNKRDDIDPMRLSDFLLDEAAAGRVVKLTFARDRTLIADLMLDSLPAYVSGGNRRESAETFIAVLEPSAVLEGGRWYGLVPPSAGGPWVPALGIAYRIEPRVARVQDGTGAGDKLQPGDEILEVRLMTGKSASTYKLEKVSWPLIFSRLQAVDPETPVQLVVRRQGVVLDEPVSLRLADQSDWPMTDRGMMLERASKVVRADGFLEAVSHGMRDSWRWIVRIYQNLHSLLVGDLSPELLSGPIGIIEVTYAAADQGLNDLILFLGIISVNLAVVNFLPIPILDGGHMVFLIVEWIRKKPASERALIIANVTGLVIIASLMAFVIFLDVSKWEWVQRLFG